MKSTLLKKLFPAARREDEEISPVSVESGGVMEPGIGGWIDSLGGMPSTDLSASVDCATGGNVQLRRLPTERLEQYEILRTMATDPTIDSSIKMHIGHALSGKSDTGEIIEITGEGAIVDELRENFTEMLNNNLERWTYKAAVFGFNPLRVYGAQGKGVELLRDDYYTHPFFTRRFERAGQTVGWSSKWQHTSGNKNGKGLIQLMDPWKFVEIRIPDWSTNIAREPIRHAGDVFDISNDNYMEEGFIEATDYGSSMIKTAYEPWIDLQEAILSLNMSRKKASNVERLIGVQTGTLNPQRAAQYLNTVSRQMNKTAEAQAQKSLRQGYVKTVWNHVIPVFGSGRGQLDISTLEGQPDIAHIEDIRFHINRLGGAVGIDPSMLGFGDMLSGGMGDGGFFRMSIQAAMRAQSIRTAVANMIEHLFEIHIALKYNKVFLEKDKPWGVKFHSLSTAIAKEHAEERDRSSQFAMSVVQIMQMINPQLENLKAEEFQRWILTDLLRVEDETADEIIKKAAPADDDLEDDDLEDDGSLFESVKNRQKLEQAVYDIIEKMG
ncbi:MAG: hypothetical protein IBX50_12425 [Marinospirillum sp.]|uniref:portal protein n=1 Tax=Marinospirillum sp. TaxID=2183934 RepID=UPI001A012008|nr:portal protein [Marinospirillum sp.]MBE0507502.1 hypothetical protein [Marinospirillum sp.]